MRTQIISLLVISTLLCSASAEFSLEPVAIFLESFAASINYADMNPTVENCSIYVNATRQAVLDLISLEIFDYPEELLIAFGDNFAQATHYCGQAAMLIPSMIEYFQSGISNLTLKSFSTNILTNSYTINKDIFYLRYSVYKGLYDDSGELFAELLKILIFGDTKIPTARQLYQLDELADMAGVSSTLADNIYSLLQGSQGFMDQAIVPEYTRLLEDLGALLYKFPVLDKAIKAEDFNATMEVIRDLYYKLKTAAKDSVTFNQQLVAFLQKELAIFSDQQKVAKGIESLMKNLPVTLANIQKIAAAYQNKDAREVGTYIRAIFNQIRDGAMSN
jgi:hypothetical protein